MALEFYIIDFGEPLNTRDDLFAAEQLLRDDWPRPTDAFADSEYGKLAPWVYACRCAGIDVGLYSDMYLFSSQIAPALDILRGCYGEIATRRPFYHPDDWEQEPFVRMVKLLEIAMAKNAAIIAYGD